ncbi:BsuPI-related putative proteinase inhibitor [Guptibacillus algicola]|uniref:BsuPI-related putative proteinase inhibitor n=1 Tax=Guptibacillus algicola TaxID=225844 RepID=UPI001CD6C338|nr:BsuPI-related putative proteinase inhibitor [Alkalihalobacillus algicola]MCA0989102.1 proteinase inhibitor [Alkalihalobacillus algicola]
MFKYLAIGSIALMTLTGCGEGNESMNSTNNGTNASEEVTSESSSGSSGIVAGSMEPSLTLESTHNGKATFTYRIQNQTEKVQTVTFPSSQKYDYKLYNEEGEVLKTYSANKSFIKEIQTAEVKQAETLDYTITLDSLPNGSYTLEIWLTVEGDDDYMKKIDFTIE